MKTILITWTSSWIWFETAEYLKKNHEIIWVSRSENKIENIDFFRWDLKNIDFLSEISQKIENIDYLILNAGIWYFDKFKNISLEKNKDIIETNLLSPILLTSLLINSNKIKSGIIFIWSIAWKKSMKNWASYAASKFGLRWFAMQLKNENIWIKINLINPKIVDTNFHKDSKIEIVGKYSETKIEDILETISNIINWSENRFEIDL